MLKWILGKFGFGCRLDSSGSGQDQLQSPVNTVMNIHVSENAGIWLAECATEGLKDCFMSLGHVPTEVWSRCCNL